jgi:hypothetical protein
MGATPQGAPREGWCVNVYTGVGSRKTPPEYLHVIRELARWLRSLGYTLRSGHADGGDLAFESGADGKADIFLPWSGFNSDIPVVGNCYPRPTTAALDIAALYHPAWEYLSHAGKKLHGRNSHEVLGVNCRPDEASAFLACWTKGAKGEGGTGQAIRVANAYGVPVFDLASPGAVAALTQFVVLRRV